MIEEFAICSNKNIKIKYRQTCLQNNHLFKKIKTYANNFQNRYNFFNFFLLKYKSKNYLYI